MTLVCLSKGGNPLATITWYRNGERVDSSYTTILNGSKNTYEFTASEEDNNAVYSCQAKNELILKPLEAKLTTVVQCKIVMFVVLSEECSDINICSDGPKDVRISGPSEAIKGDELNFECSTSNSNPPVEIWWVVDGRAVQVGGIYSLIFNFCLFPSLAQIAIVRNQFLFGKVKVYV